MRSFYLRVAFVLRFFAVALQNGFLCRSVFMREESFVLQAVRVSPANGRPVDDCFSQRLRFTYSVFSPRLCQKLWKKGVDALTVTVQNRGWYCVRVRVPDLFSSVSTRCA